MRQSHTNRLRTPKNRLALALLLIPGILGGGRVAFAVDGDVDGLSPPRIIIYAEPEAWLSRAAASNEAPSPGPISVVHDEILFEDRLVAAADAGSLAGVIRVVRAADVANDAPSRPAARMTTDATAPSVPAVFPEASALALGGGFEAVVVVHDQETFDAWRSGAVWPGVLDGFETNEWIAVEEAVVDVHVRTRDEDGSIVESVFRIRSSDGALRRLERMRLRNIGKGRTDWQKEMQDNEHGNDAIVAGGGPGPWHPYCCETQFRTCMQLADRCCNPSGCHECQRQCDNEEVPNPCHSCEWCGGSDVYCAIVPGGRCGKPWRFIAGMIWLLICQIG